MLPIYFINTAPRADRREHMERAFRDLGLPAIRFEAVLVKDLPADLIQKHCGPNSRHKHGAGHLACTVSHQQVWQTLVESGAEAALIFEDDAILSPDLPGFLESLGDRLPPGIDMLKVETFFTPAQLGSQVRSLPNGHSLRRLLGTHYGSCGYIMSRHLAEQLLSDPGRLDLVIDQYMFGRDGPVIHRYKVYQAAPALSAQLSRLPSPVESSVAESDLKVERQALRRRTRSGFNRLLRRLRPMALDAIHFAYDLRGLHGPRHNIPLSGAELQPAGGTPVDVTD